MFSFFVTIKQKLLTFTSMRGKQISASGSVDFGNVVSKHPNKWVALSADSRKVVGVANTPKKAIKQAHINKEISPILTRVPKNPTAFIL